MGIFLQIRMQNGACESGFCGGLVLSPPSFYLAILTALESSEVACDHYYYHYLLLLLQLPILITLHPQLKAPTKRQNSCVKQHT